mmetsp:Transcript_24418/g.44256  ORF Transcript_24418/g.44256 Transcript_24418/m.44256 type:complete len:722 (+) Transcript_24418:60-2225(+)
MTNVRCTVRYHRGVEQQAQAQGDEDPAETLLLRVSIKLSNAPEGQYDELQLHGTWAIMLMTVGPGDRLQIESAEELPDTEQTGTRCFSISGTRPVVVVFREGKRARIDMEAVENLQLPDWLKPPSTKPTKVGGAYQYHRWLCTLRDGADANIWGVVWENSKPGAAISGGWVKQNVTLVDPIYDHCACTEWSANKQLAQYSLTLGVNISQRPGNTALEAMPFLCVGDVVRVHRARIHAKPPRYMNIRPQTGSAMVAFPCPSSMLTEDEYVAGAEVESCNISASGTHTIVDSDRMRAHSLQAWIQKRLSSETMSGFLAMASELCAMPERPRDLIVQVLEVNRNARQLVVTDGSLDRPVSVEVVQQAHASAVAWVFLHVKTGHWLKLREATVAGTGDSSASQEGDGAVLLRALGATITRVPEWCMDVQVRGQQMRARFGDAREEAPPAEAPAAPGTPMPHVDAADQQAEADTKRAGEAKEARRISGDTELDPEEEEEDEAKAEQANVPAAAAAVEVKASSAPPAAPHPCSQLSTVYAECVVPVRVSDLCAAVDSGKRCVVLGDFKVARIFGISGGDATSVANLLCARCRACGHTFPASFAGDDVRAAKRQRKVLPCGHWLFRLEYRFKLGLQDAGAPANAPEFHVFVVDEAGELLGAKPDEVASDPAARLRAQQLLEALQKDAGQDRTEFGHTLAVYRIDGPTCGAYVVCDTALKLVPSAAAQP